MALGCGPSNGGDDDGATEGTTLDSTGQGPSTGDEPTTGDAASEVQTTDPQATDSETGDTDTTDGDTTDEPPQGDCSEPQSGVDGISLEISLDPPPPFGTPIVLDEECVVEERLATDVQDGLAMRCKQDGGEVVLRVTYVSGQLLLPDSAAVGIGVRARVVTYEMESRNYSVIVTANDDGRIVMAVHAGAGAAPFVDGVGELVDFWAPLTVDRVQPTGCAVEMGSCQSEVQRGSVRFALGDEELVLFDRQLGELGPLGLHLGSATALVSDDNMCDGGTDEAQDFVVVHDPA